MQWTVKAIIILTVSPMSESEMLTSELKVDPLSEKNVKQIENEVVKSGIACTIGD